MRSSETFIKNYAKKLTPSFVVLLLLFIGALLLFVYIAHEVLWEKEEEADLFVFNFLSNHVISDSLTGFMKSVTHFASSRFLQIAYAVLIILFLIQKNWKRALEVAVIGLGGYLINYAMKLSFQRLRPPNPLIKGLENFSFPSGHATSAFIFYGLLSYLIWKTELPKVYKYIAIVILISFSLLIGFSRVYLRVHYTSDVVAGFCVGFAWLMLATWLFWRLKKKSDDNSRFRQEPAITNR